MAISIPAGLGRRNDRIFYSGMAIVVAGLVFAGFSRTYYLSAYFHARPLSTLRMVHGALFTAWYLLFITQTALIAARRTDVHRRLGVAGAVLAASMVVIGSVLAISAARDGRAPPGMEPRAFLVIPLLDMLVFGVLVTAGIYFRRQPETHKRLMLLATIRILGAAVARLPTGLVAFGPLFFFGVVDLLVLVGPIYDLVKRHRVHPAYIWGGLLVIASHPLRLMLSGTHAWLAFANMVTGR